jgi:hypothetical protein
MKKPNAPTPTAWRIRDGAHAPAIFHIDRGPELFPRKTKTTPEAALEYARRVMWWRKIRTDEAKRRLGAISDPWWVEVVAGMNQTARPMLVHRPVNRERTAYQGWGCR